MKQVKEQLERNHEKQMMKKRFSKKQAGKGLMGLGLLLLMAAILLTGYNIWDSRRAELAAAETAEKLRLQIYGTDQSLMASGGWDSLQIRGEGEELPLYLRYPEMEMPVVMSDGNAYIGLLTIPVLELELPVLSRWSYPNLKIAPCRYAGSAYQEDMIIAGHNYSGYFHDLNLLSQGDQVVFTDASGNIFCYQVIEIETLGAAAFEEMESGEWDLTLFTCTYDGRERITVRCERVTAAE